MGTDGSRGTMLAVDWEDYWRVGPATSDEIARVESTLGRLFPQDVREALRDHQGMAPVPAMLEVFPERPRVDFGPLFHCREGSSGNLLARVELLRRRGYPATLVPISMSSGGQSHFALDYSHDAPRIAFVRPELGYDSDRCVVPVADSLTELLARLEPE
ncbi:MAG: SMI1/KNR4 family protein [Sandaracinaceae bacterium]